MIGEILSNIASRSFKAAGRTMNMGRMDLQSVTDDLIGLRSRAALPAYRSLPGSGADDLFSRTLQGGTFPGRATANRSLAGSGTENLFSRSLQGETFPGAVTASVPALASASAYRSLPGVGVDDLFYRSLGSMSGGRNLGQSMMSRSKLASNSPVSEGPGFFKKYKSHLGAAAGGAALWEIFDKDEHSLSSNRPIY